MATMIAFFLALDASFALFLALVVAIVLIAIAIAVAVAVAFQGRASSACR